MQAGRWSRLAALVVLAAALAYIEASVVVYLRQAITPVRRKYLQRTFPMAISEPLPLLSLDQLRQAGPPVDSFLLLEQLREAAALAVLAAAAVGLRHRGGEGLAFFLIGFAVWDGLYYAFLKLLIDWPASLGTWDVLFLIPVPWLAPVWAPLLVSLSMLLAGLLRLSRPTVERPVGTTVGASLTILAGAGLVLVSFVIRVGEAVGAIPARFDWPWFLAGWLLGTAGLFWLFASRSRRRL
ncbi:MAG: hypothetical protein B1H04_06480 [Planctomycetales bacterium 4484_123]|nr:MAG: hypothetical protein B1H04_06480 [Planctomycetales bacterium 4484_123]